jgi:protein-disulfide isomerase
MTKHMMRYLLALVALIAGFGSVAVAAGRDWTGVVTKSANGSFVIGNPNAKVKLVEYVSYTCPHCAHFIAESGSVLRGQMVRSGSTSVELRNAVRDRLDLTAALLARCTGPKGFFATTDAIFAAQDDWIERGSRFETVNGARIAAYPQPAQLKALADGSGLSDIMTKRGMTDAAIGACLANEAEQAVVVKNTSASWAKIHGTPAFELNGKTVDTTEWAVLEKSLRAAGAK